MSTSIDERIVSMRFDNSNFERNISTTMSTLDRFNNRLRFTGALEGLNNVNNASNRMDLSGMGQAVEAVRVRFSALEVMAITAISNITNSAINMGKNLISSFTIAPISSGLDEYETKMNAIQTIMTNTASKGTTLDQVTDTLNELNTYADKTIYNFAEMTRNIGTFTAAGVGLKDSASSIQGIANLAAASGSNAQQASTAMYQLSQALASGSVKLMDWNSVVNAGMGGELFQEALKKTAREHGIAVDAIIKKQGSFRESLKNGWLSADVLNKTLNKFTVKGATEYADAMIKSGKYTKEQAKALLEQAQRMEDAATKVKTFTQLLDTLKEAAQSGWAQTWELIIGNFDQAKELFTSLSDQFGGMIASSAKARNDLLADTLNSKWDTFLGKLKLAGVSTEDYSEVLKKTVKKNGLNIDDLIKKYGSLGNAVDNGAIPAKNFTDALKEIVGTGKKSVDSMSGLNTKLSEFQKVVDQVWYGTYKNGKERMKELADKGYDYLSVQKLVNRTIDGHKLTLQDLTKEQVVSIAVSKKMSDAQLKTIGFNKQQIDALRGLAEQAEKTGTPLNELILGMGKKTGRVLMLETLQNVLKAIINPLSAIKKAWDQVFGTSPKGLYGTIQTIHDVTAQFIMSEKTANKLTRTFSGVFSIFKIIADVVGGAVTYAFKLLSPILGTTSVGILDITAAIGDAITNFKDTIEKGNLIALTFDKIGKTASSGIQFILKWFRTFAQMPIVSSMVNKFKNNLSGLSEVGKNILDGLKNSLMDQSKSLPDILIAIGKSMLTAIKKVLGIHSPSKEMYGVGENVVQGLTNGISNGLKAVTTSSESMANAIVKVFNNIPWGTLIAGAITAGTTIAVKNLSESIKNFSKPAEGLGELLTSTAGVVHHFSKVLGATALSIKMSAIKNLAIAIAIIVGAIVLLTFIDPAKTWAAVGVVTAIGGIILGLSVAADKLIKAEPSFRGGIGAAVKMGTMLITLGISLLLLSAAVTIIGKMKPEQAAQGFAGLILLIAGLLSVVKIMEIVSTPGNDIAIKAFSKMMIQMGAAFLLMTLVVKILGSMKFGQILQGELAIVGMVGIITLVSLVTKLASDKTIAHFGKMMSSLGVAFLLMAIAIKLLGGMDPLELMQGELAIAGMVVIIGGLVLLSKKAGTGSTMVGMARLFTSIGTALLMMAIVVKILGGMDMASIAKGELALGAMVGMIVGLIWSFKLIERDVPKAAATILAISVAIGILAAIAIALSLIDGKGLAKGILAITYLATIMGGLMYASQYAKDSTGSLIALTVAIGVMAASVIALSLINPLKLAGAVLAVGMLTGMFILLMHGTKFIQGSMGNLIVLTVAVGILSGAILLLSMIPFKDAMSGVVALSTLLAVFVGSMYILDKMVGFGPMAMASIGIMVVLVATLSGVLMVLSKVPMNSLLASATALSLLLLALTASIVILSNTRAASIQALASLAAMGILIGSLSTLMIAMVQISKVSWGDIAKGLVLIAGVFIILAGAAYAISPVSGVLIAISVSLVLIGVAMIEASVAMMIFGASLPIIASGIIALGSAFDKSGASVAKGLVLMVTTIAALIPVMAVGIGKGIIILSIALAAGAPVLANSIGTILLAMIRMIIIITPQLMTAVEVVLVSLMTMLADAIPRLVDLGMKMILGILNGINKRIKAITIVAIDIMINFIDGITKMLPKVIDAGFRFIISFINGLANAIDKNSGILSKAIGRLLSSMVASMFDIGINVAQGLGDGIIRGLGKIREAVGNVAQSAVTYIKNLLGIKSPSRVFRKIGEYTTQGMAIGITSYGFAVKKAVKDVGTKAVSTMHESMSKLSNVITNIDMGNLNPTITPVLDLSNVNAGVRDMRGMFGAGMNIGVKTNVDAISRMSNSRQSENNKLFDLINSLNPASNITHNHYSIAGVTYDDGSNIAKAIETIVRVANVERRR